MAPTPAGSYPTHEPPASQLMNFARALGAHPCVFFHSYEDAPASEKDEARAAKKASEIRLDGEKLARMR